MHMTKPFYVLAVVLLVLAGCHRKLGTYRNMNKWLIPQGNDRRPLNGHPKEVTEYSYMAMDTVDTAKRRKMYQKFGFNADGDLIKGSTYINDTLVMTSDNHFDSTGLQQTLTNVKTGQTMQTVTERMPDGRYKTTAEHAKSAPTVVYSSFMADNKAELEQASGGRQQGMGPSGVHIFYDGYRITKVTSSAPTGDLEERFFYSRWDTPDSIDIYSGKGNSMRLMEREVYEMNDHGDPVRRLQLMGNDTSTFEVFQYTYDDKGNWTRRVSKSLKAPVMGLPPRPTGIVERVYEY